MSLLVRNVMVNEVMRTKPTFQMVCFARPPTKVTAKSRLKLPKFISYEDILSQYNFINIT